MKKYLTFGLIYLVLPCLLAILPIGTSAFTSQLAAQEAVDTTAQTRWQRFRALFFAQDAPPQKEVEKPEAIKSLESSDLSVMDRYGLIYNLIHSEEQQKYQRLIDSNYTDWETLQQLKKDAKYIGAHGDTLVLARNIKVFGWHPFWMGPAYKDYSYNLLSHVSLFQLSVATGSDTAVYDNPEVVDSWYAKDFNLVELAHEKDCKVLITITNFEKDTNEEFLSDVFRQNRLIDKLMTILSDLGADGIDVNFEQVPAGYEKKLSSFIKRLSARLTGGQNEYLLSVVLPKINDDKVYNIDTLQKYVDIFVLTGYDFAGSFYEGPTSPLYNPSGYRGKNTSIEDVVFSYLENGLDRKKLLLGLPFYGGKWSHLSGKGRSDTTVYKHLTYSNIKRQFRLRGDPTYDLARWGAKYQYVEDATLAGYDTSHTTIWFDDSLTMSVKYDWVLEQGLGGVGIWALGYDHPYPEMWALIENKFAPVNDTLVYFNPQQESFKLVSAIMNYGDLIGVSALFIFVFLAIGFVLALFDWRVREVFFEQKTLRLLYIVAAFALLLAGLSIYLYLHPQTIDNFTGSTVLVIILLVGLCLGALVVWRISKAFATSRSRLP